MRTRPQVQSKKKKLDTFAQMLQYYQILQRNNLGCRICKDYFCGFCGNSMYSAKFENVGHIQILEWFNAKLPLNENLKEKYRIVVIHGTPFLFLIYVIN